MLGDGLPRRYKKASIVGLGLGLELPNPNPSSLTLAAIEIVARVNGRQRTGKGALPTPNTTVDPSTLTMVHPWRIEVLSMILGVFCSNG